MVPRATPVACATAPTVASWWRATRWAVAWVIAAAVASWARVMGFSTGLLVGAATRPAGLIRLAVPGKALVVQVVEEGGQQLRPVWLHGRVQQPPELVDRSLPLLGGELVQHPIEVVGVHGRSLRCWSRSASRAPASRPPGPTAERSSPRQQPGRRGRAGQEQGATSRRSASSTGSVPGASLLGRTGSVGARLRRSSLGAT